MSDYLTAFLAVFAFAAGIFALRALFKMYESRLPRFFQSERVRNDRTLARVFSYNSSWYAYYYPGGPHKAYGVGPCETFDEAAGVLCRLTGCENVCTLSPCLNEPMPERYKTPVEMSLKEFKESRYAPPLPFVSAMARYGGRWLSQLGPGG